MTKIKIKQNGKGDKTWVIAVIVLAVVGFGWINRYNDFDDYREPPSTGNIQDVLRYSAKVLAKSPKSISPTQQLESPAGIISIPEQDPSAADHRE